MTYRNVIRALTLSAFMSSGIVMWIVWMFAYMNGGTILITLNSFREQKIEMALLILILFVGIVNICLSVMEEKE